MVNVYDQSLDMMFFQLHLWMEKKKCDNLPVFVQKGEISDFGTVTTAGV